MSKAPDYSQYSLEELREMAGRTGKQLFSRESARLMREIEKREQAQNGGEAVQAAPGCGRILLHTCGGMVLAHFVLVIARGERASYFDTYASRVPPSAV